MTSNRVPLRAPIPCMFVLITLVVSTSLSAADTVPATVEQAVKVIDMRTVKLPEGAVTAAGRQVASVTYEIQSDPKLSYQRQQQELIKAGWKELPGSLVEAAYGNGMFQKSGFVILLSTSESGQPDQPGMSRVSLSNFGNVRPASLPVVKSAKSSFANEATAMYFTEAKPEEVVEATAKLMTAAGWEPYGTSGSLPDFLSMNFKRNAVQAQASVGISPAQQGKTSIMYATQLLSVDLPAPANAADVQYVDMLKTLRFTSSDDYDGVGKFYQQRLAGQGWTPTTPQLVKSTDRFKRPIAMQIFRNVAKDMLTLELSTQDEKTHAVIKHLSDDELAELEKKVRDDEQKLLAEQEARQKKSMREKKPTPGADVPDIDAIINDALNNSPAAKETTVRIPIPQKAKKVDRTSDNVLQIKLPAGKGKGAAESIRDQLVAAKWKLDDDADLDETAGNLTFKKGSQQVTLTYVDTGLSDVMMMVIGIGAKLEPAKESPAAKGSEKKPASETVKEGRPATIPDEPMPEPKTSKEKPKKGIANLEKLPNSGTLTMGEMKFKLTHVVAYRSKLGDEVLTTVLITEKPINMEKLKASLKKDGTDDGLFEFQAQVRLQIDDADKVQSVSLWADNVSVSGNSDVEGQVLVEDGRVRGTARLAKPGEFFKKMYTFDVSFDAALLVAPTPKK